MEENRNQHCANCKHYHYEYFVDKEKTIRLKSGFCHRTKIHTRKKPEFKCSFFVLREVECIEEITIRRQELLAEIEEATKLLKRLKMLAELASRIQNEFGIKED